MEKTQETVMARGNIMPPEKFNPPTKYTDVESNRPCYVYDPRAWRNKNKRSSHSEGGENA